MKKTRFVVLLLCVALLMLSVSCKKDVEGNGVPTDAITTEGAPVTEVPDVTTDGTASDTDVSTEESTSNSATEPTEPSVTDTMSSSECFEYASDKFFTILENLKNGFLPEMFSEAVGVEGGMIKLSADSVSIFGNPVIESAFALSGEYVKNENGLASSGKFDGETELGYQLYVNADGSMYIAFPQVEENVFVGLDTGREFDFSSILGDGFTSDEETDVGSIFKILEEVFGDATDKLITEEKLEITVYGKKYNTRKLIFSYVLTGTSADTYGVDKVTASFYVFGDDVLRAEFELEGEKSNTLSMDFGREDDKTVFSAELASGESTVLNFEGEQSATLDFGEIKFNFASSGTEIANAGISVSYERREASGTVFTDYALGIVASAGMSEMTVAIPIHTEYTSLENGVESFKLSIDTVKDNIPKLLADIRASFEFTRIEKSEGVVVFPEFTDENTIMIDDESDAEALKAYYEKLNAQAPDIKELLCDILELFGVELPGSNEAVYLNGTYAQKGIVSITKFTFDEDGKVVLALVTYEIEGRYSIVGDEITLDFGDGHALTGTFSFELNDNTIVIDGTEYVKQ